MPTAARCCATIGAASVEALYRGVPRAALLERPVDLPRGMGELEVERDLQKLAAKNIPAGSVPSFLGCGAYRHHVPAAVDYLVQRGEFLTSYTPYQPEIAQGTLQALFEFQTQVALITGMEVANASLYDGATAAAEAVMMANRLTRRKKAVLAGNLHPHYAETIATYARFNGFDLVTRPPDPTGNDDPSALIDGATSCVVVQNPGFFGHLRDLAPLAEACHKAGALLVAVVTEPVSLGLVKPPGEMGADIVAGEGAADRQRARLRRALSRPVRDARQICAADAGAACRADARCRGAARLRAHAVGARAAYPAREGDEQHLHQFGPVRVGIRDPHGASGRGRVCAPGRAQPRQGA